MKKVYLLVMATMTIFTVNAQVFSSNFDNWSDGLPTDWVGTRTNLEDDSIKQVSGNYGANAAQLVNTESSHKRFTTQNLTSEKGQSYEVKFWVKGKGDVRSGLIDDTYHYSDYITIDSDTWAEYTQTVTSSESVDTAQFMLSLRNTVMTNHLEVDSFVVTKTTVEAEDVSIYDIQYTTDESGDSPYMDQTVNTGGIVSAVVKNDDGEVTAYYIQSGVGAWNGVYVYDYNNTVAMGDSVTFTAKVVEYYNLTELKDVINFTLVSSDNTLYSAQKVSTLSANSERYEGVLLKIINGKCTNADAGYGEFIVDDNSGELNIDDKIYKYTATLDKYYNITGVLDYSYSKYHLLPRMESDIEVSNSVESVNAAAVSIFPNPAKDIISVKGENISSVTIMDINGRVVKTVNNLSLETTIDISTLTQGVYFVEIKNNNTTKTTRLVKL